MKTSQLFLLATLLWALPLVSCVPDKPTETVPRSATGVSKVTANVRLQANGHTVEQNNITRRVELENTPGSIKHLYLVSSFTNKVIKYSTVAGKVTSSEKRLTPSKINGGFDIKFPGKDDRYSDMQLEGFAYNRDWASTDEVLGDDGTYGSSIEYLYWFDAEGKYHQLYPPSGAILLISDQPMSFE